MSTAKSPLYERDLALPVKDYLRAEGWELYEEVSYAGKISDIVATRGDELAVVELKTSLGFPVICQAKNWLEHANCSWIAVPSGKATPEREEALEVCAWRAIGVLVVRPLSKLEEERQARGELGSAEPRVRVVQAAVPQPTFPYALRAVLAPEHQTHAPAGSKTGVRWNATTERHAAVRSYIEEHGGTVPLEDVVPALGGSTTILRESVEAARMPMVRLNGAGPSVMLELVTEGDEAPIYSTRSLRTRPRR
jgi:hypothetical protein